MEGMGKRGDDGSGEEKGQGGGGRRGRRRGRVGRGISPPRSFLKVGAYGEGIPFTL